MRFSAFPRTLLASILFAAIVIGGCPPAPFQFGGPSVYPPPSDLGLGAPRVALPLADVRVAVTDNDDRTTPVRVRPGGAVTWRAVVTRTGLGKTDFRIEDANHDPANAVLTTTYAIGAGLSLPVDVGQRVSVTYHASAAGGHQLVVVDDAGVVLGVVARGTVSAGSLPLPINVAIAQGPEHVVYTESFRLPSLCLAVIEHRNLRVDLNGVRHVIGPGGQATLGGPVGYTFVAHDAQRLLPSVCAKGRDQLSWALIRSAVTD